MTKQTATSQTAANDYGFESYDAFLACFETDDDPRTAQTSQTAETASYENPDGSIVRFEI